MNARVQPSPYGRTKNQHLCLVAAATGKLFQLKKDLVFRHPCGTFKVVRTFGKQTVKECTKAGWLMYGSPGDDGAVRIMTTCAGDAELRKPLRLVKPRATGFDADCRREALR